MRAKRAGYAVTFLCERSESVTPAAGERFLGLTARKTSRCNLAEISFVPSSQSTFNFSVLRGTQVDLLLFNVLRPGPGATRLAGEPDFFEKYSFYNASEGIWEDTMLQFGAPTEHLEFLSSGFSHIPQFLRGQGL